MTLGMRVLNVHADELRKLPPFSFFDEAQLARIFPHIEHRKYAARVFVQQAGAVADGIYILLTGRVQVVHIDREGREFIAATVRAHGFFGELGLAQGICIASIRTSEHCEVLYIPRAIVIDCLTTNVQAAFCMLESVTKRFASCYRKLTEFATTNVYERTAGALVENTSAPDGEATLPFGCEELARRVGASREMVSRVLRQMMDQGVVRRDKRKLIVTDRQALLKRAPPTR